MKRQDRAKDFGGNGNFIGVTIQLPLVLQKANDHLLNVGHGLINDITGHLYHLFYCKPWLQKRAILFGKRHFGETFDQPSTENTFWQCYFTRHRLHAGMEIEKVLEQRRVIKFSKVQVYNPHSSKWEHYLE